MGASNLDIGLIVAVVGVTSWGLAYAIDPDGQTRVPSWVMFVLALGMAVVSSLSVAGENGLVAIFAATNRTIVAGYGVITLYRVLRLHGHLRRLGRHEP